MMRALTDLVCGTSACPADIDASNGWNLTEIQVRGLSEGIPRSSARSDTEWQPDAPLQLTRESGFPPAHVGPHPQLRRLPRFLGAPLLRPTPAPSKNTGRAANVPSSWICRRCGRWKFSAPDSEQFLQGIITRDVRKLSVGQILLYADVLRAWAAWSMTARCSGSAKTISAGSAATTRASSAERAARQDELQGEPQNGDVRDQQRRRAGSEIARDPASDHRDAAGPTQHAGAWRPSALLSGASAASQAFR